jgi:16S rRNA (uracil1498-N3)-methyltransferase
VTFDRAETRHLARVLRLGAGDVVLATDGRGREYTVRLETLGPTATGAIVAVASARTESLLTLTLVQAIPKGDKMEMIIRAATELGVSRVIPARAARTVVRLAEEHWLERARRWQRVAREAAKQCGRAVIPEIAVALPLGRALQAAQDARVRICLWEEEIRPLTEVLRESPPPPCSVAVAVGPEGGFALDEVAHARSLGWATAGLGPRILRAETASIATLAIIGAVLGSPPQANPSSHKGDRSALPESL